MFWMTLSYVVAYPLSEMRIPEHVPQRTRRLRPRLVVLHGFRPVLRKKLASLRREMFISDSSPDMDRLVALPFFSAAIKSSQVNTLHTNTKKKPPSASKDELLLVLYMLIQRIHHK